MIKKFGITGGIGSGKTTVCNIICNLGYPVYYSDIRATVLANRSESLKKEIKYVFGEDSYIDNKYNREYIASIVFTDKSKLELLNTIFGRYVDKDFYKFCKISKDFGENIVFYESALIYEHNKENDFDHIICVYAKEDIIYERLRNRNNFSDEQIKNRLESQMSPSLKINKTPWVIDTTNGINEDEIKNLIEILK